MYGRENLSLLSEREREIFLYIAKGLTNTEIAQQCYISLDTVKSHIRTVYKKLAVKNRSQIVIYAFVTGEIIWNEEEGRLVCRKK